MKVQAPSNHSQIQVPAIILTNLFVTAAQVFKMAKEYGATVGQQIAVNFTEQSLGAASLYSVDSLESTLRHRRIEAMVRSHANRAVRVRVGTKKEARLEFTGVLGSADECYLWIQVKATKVCRDNRVIPHRKPVKISVRRQKVAFIEPA